MYKTCQLPIFHNANLPLPEMLHCISESVGLQINIFFFLALLFLQSYLVHATQLQRRPSLHIMQNWAGCAWPRRGQLYKGARRLLRKRKEEELTGLHIASPLSERRRIYTTCKAAA